MFTCLGSPSCPGEEMLRDCYESTSPCMTTMKELALECRCQGWTRWTIADYSPRPANGTETRHLRKWDRRVGYDYDILYNGVATCSSACSNIASSSKPTGVRFICNAAAAVGSIFFSTEHEGCSTKNDGIPAIMVCDETIENNVFFEGHPVTMMDGGERYCSGSSDPENQEDYLRKCLQHQGCIDELDYHAIECECTGPMPNLEVPSNCIDDDTGCGNLHFLCGKDKFKNIFDL